MVITYNFNKILEKYLQTSSTYFLVIFWLFRDIRIITSAAASKRKSYLRLRATQKALQYTVLQSHFRSANYSVFIRRRNNFEWLCSGSKKEKSSYGKVKNNKKC